MRWRTLTTLTLLCGASWKVLLQFHQPAKLEKIQLLSHEFKIPSRVEIWVLPATTLPEQDGWQHLGFVRLGNNERTSFEARELKTVYVEAEVEPVQKVKLVLHECHFNKLNGAMQVALVSISVFGVTDGSPQQFQSAGEQSMPNLPPRWNGPLTDPVGKSTFADPGVWKPPTIPDPKHKELIDSETIRAINKLQYEKEAAVAVQDYETAQRCKLSLANLEVHAMRLMELEAEKVAAAAREEFDVAHHYKMQLDELRALALQPEALAQSRLSDMGPESPTGLHRTGRSPKIRSPKGLNVDLTQPISPATMSPEGSTSSPPGRGTSHLSPQSQGTGELTPRELALTEAKATGASPGPPGSGGVPSWEEMERAIEEKKARKEPKIIDPDERPLNVGRPQAMDWDVDPIQRAMGTPGDGHLPMPEPLASDDQLKLAVVISVFGEELARCSRSENRVLRQYALMKCVELLPEIEPTTDSLNATALLVQLATEEKVPLVFECGMRLLRLSLDAHQDLADKDIAAAYEAVVQGLRHRTDTREPVSSRGHAASRTVFRHATDGLLFCSKKDMLRPAVSKAVSEPMLENGDKEKLALTVSGRMELLAALLGSEESNISVPGSVSLDDLMPWIKEGISSENQEVYGNTKDCLVELGQQLQGTPWNRITAELTPAQKTEIDAALQKTVAAKAQLAQMRQLAAS